ncbi:Uncharacterised protein [Mycobacteroides abscessus subsp. massiliense]|nr:Uncharacterised protein [Mycobacteroides abscessus subsp. abscessus]SKK93041.1 Uncharacterised protein [Mycobacteroides abscessus subsp. massiliense]SKR11362.1 Uncharacterised protein [Mycobacteroides abscessus subsp. massiliense]
MVFFQMSDGRPDPYIGPPQLVLMGLPSSVPTHTAVESDGVKPTIQASLLSLVSPSCAVPVLDADSRPPASACPREYAAMGFIAEIALLATSSEMRFSPVLSEEPASNSTWPSAFTTFWMKCGLR